MDYNGNKKQEGLFIPMNERLLVIFMGLLISGLAHGASEPGIAKDCSIQNGNGTAAQELTCTSLDKQSNDKITQRSGQNSNPAPDEQNDNQATYESSQGVTPDQTITTPKSVVTPHKSTTEENDTRADHSDGVNGHDESINSLISPANSTDKAASDIDTISNDKTTPNNPESGVSILHKLKNGSEINGGFSTDATQDDTESGSITSPGSAENNDTDFSPDPTNDSSSDDEPPSNGSKSDVINPDIKTETSENGAAPSAPRTPDSAGNNSAASPETTDSAASGDGASTDNSKTDNTSGGITSEDSNDSAATGDINSPDTTNTGSMSPEDSSDKNTTNLDSEDKGTSDSQAGVTGDPKQLATDGTPTNSPTIKPKAEIFNLDKAAAVSEQNEAAGESERDLFTIGGASNKTSDHYQARTYSLSYRNHRREWFWPWQEAEDKDGLDWGLDIYRTVGNLGVTDLKATNVAATLGGYVDDGTYLKARVGHHELNTDSGDRTITPHQVVAMFGLDSDFSVQLENNRDFIYTSGSVTGGITKQLAATNTLGSFRWHPEKRIRVEGQAGYSKYDQDNEARQGNISALYGISPDWPWIWAGLGAEVLSFHRNVSDYWSPNRFYAYGLRIESSFPINDRLTGSLSNSLNRQQERQLYTGDYTYGSGYELSAGLQYRIYNQVHARLEISKSKSLQNGTAWRSSNIFFSVNMPLF